MSKTPMLDKILSKNKVQASGDMHDLEYRLQSGKTSQADAIVELEAHIRECDQMLGSALGAMEIAAHDAYEPCRKAAVELRNGLNTLYTRTTRIKK